MRAGRLPEDHPLEQLARAKLRAKSPQAAAKAEQEMGDMPASPPPRVSTGRTSYSQPPQRVRPQPKRRWG